MRPFSDGYPRLTLPREEGQTYGTLSRTPLFFHPEADPEVAGT